VCSSRDNRDGQNEGMRSLNDCIKNLFIFCARAESGRGIKECKGTGQKSRDRNVL
jgi:hypothetical protein